MSNSYKFEKLELSLFELGLELMKVDECTVLPASVSAGSKYIVFDKTGEVVVATGYKTLKEIKEVFGDNIKLTQENLAMMLKKGKNTQAIAYLFNVDEAFVRGFAFCLEEDIVLDRTALKTSNPSFCNKVVTLYEIEWYTMVEIAKELGCSRPTVKKILETRGVFIRPINVGRAISKAKKENPGISLKSLKSVVRRKLQAGWKVRETPSWVQAINWTY